MTRPPTTTRRRAAAVALATLVALAAVGAAVDALVPRATSTGSRAVSGASAAKQLRIHARRQRRTVLPGAAVRYRVQIRRGARLVRPTGHSHGRRRLAARVSLRVARPLPRGVTATFKPAVTRSTTAMLTLRTRTGVRSGAHRVRLRARGRLGRAARHRVARAQTSVVLVVPKAVRGTFTVAGTLAELLAPGRSLPLDLRLTNPHDGALRIGHLAVSVAAVHAPEADATHPCTVGDFSVVPFSGPYEFTLPASGTASLSALGIPSRQWPRIAMANRPVNQDGCKHAALALSFLEIPVQRDR